MSDVFRLIEPLEPRILLCAAELSAEYVQWLNSLPDDSPAPYRADLYDPHHHDLESASAPVPANWVTILNNGPSSNRVDITLVGDGYTSTQLGTYATHANNFVNSFFNEQPLAAYKPYFNVHRVDVISNESGVSHDPTFPIWRDTALEMRFWCNNIERLLCVNVLKAQSYASNAPWDQIIGIANSTKYGGAGYPGNNLGTYAGGNFSALEIARHEFGHSFALLADEYDYGGPQHYSGPERPEPNVSIHNASQMASMQTKWHLWLDHPEVDTFEGAFYSETGIFRPTFNSKMRSLNRPWGPVNSEQLVLSVYKTVRPIDDATSPGQKPSTQTFFVQPMQPVGHNLDVQWLINGQVIPGATGWSYNPSELDLSGTHVLSVRVVDSTPLVRDENARAAWMTEQRTWRILDAIPPRVEDAWFEVDAPAMNLALRFNEDVSASLAPSDITLVNLTSGETVPTGNIGLAYAAATHTATFTFPGYASGILPDGVYRVTVPAGSVQDAAGNALENDFELHFFALAGDANRDGVVNISDLSILATNWQQPGAVFTMGDFNYSGTVDIADLSILAANWQKSLDLTLLNGSAAVTSAVAADDDIDAAPRQARRMTPTLPMPQDRPMLAQLEKARGHQNRLIDLLEPAEEEQV